MSRPHLLGGGLKSLPKLQRPPPRAARQYELLLELACAGRTCKWLAHCLESEIVQAKSAVLVGSFVRSFIRSVDDFARQLCEKSSRTGELWRPSGLGQIKLVVTCLPGRARAARKKFASFRRAE